MNHEDVNYPDSAVSGTDPAIEHLKEAISRGENWYVALLEAIGLWKKAKETYNGRVYRYLVSGEAFDWMLLAERLCEAVPGLISEADKDALLFHGKPPINLNAAKFRELLGAAKYHHYLNYFYGITAEEALVLAVEDEIRKEKGAWGYSRHVDTTAEAYRRIYGVSFATLVRHFRRESGCGEGDSMDLTQFKEFTYWRFKLRLKICEKARVASDSRKAINWLKEHGVASYVHRQDVPEYIADEAETI